MKLLNVTVVNHVFRRFVGHKRHVRRKMLKDRSYVPWKSKEAVESLEETLNTPYQQIVPSSIVRRVSETNPANHSYEDVGKFYVIPPEHRKRYFQLGGVTKHFGDLCDIFNETAIMIRKPAVEVIECMKKANYEKLPVKYVLYGDMHCGKRITKLHVLHYALLNGFVVFDLPSVSHFFKFGRRDANISESRPPLIDLPLEAAILLKHFQLLNTELVKDLKLQTTKEYVWSQRESTPAGTPLMTLVNYGINRVKYACDCIDGLIYELKAAATNGQAKVSFFVTGFNSFFAEKTMIKIKEKGRADARETSIFQSLTSIFEPNWCNGAIVLLVCEKDTVPTYRGSSFPFFLLRREGFEMLDPFIPIEVSKLSELEFHSLLDYFEDRRWLHRIGAREELELLTSRVAGQVTDYCSSL